MLWRAWWLLALTVGAPVALIALHTSVRLPGGWKTVLTGTGRWDSAPVLLNLAAGAGWLLWAWALYEVVAAAIARMRQLRRTQTLVAPPAQGRVAALVGSAVLLLDALVRTTTTAVPTIPEPVATTHTGEAGQSTSQDGTHLAGDTKPATEADAALGEDAPPAGVDVPGGWLPTPTANAVAAAAAGFWLARRRYYRPRPPGDGIVKAPLPLPAGVVAVRGRANAAITDDELQPVPLTIAASAPVVATAGATPHGPLLLADLPHDGLGLVGPAAPAAVRAALVAATAARWPVVAVAGDLAALLETSPAASAANLPTAILTADLATALAYVTSQRLTGPLLLLAAPPPPGAAADQLTTMLGDPGVIAVLLGGWSAGTTWDVDTDGTARSHPTAAGPVARLGVLDPATTGDILSTLAATHRRASTIETPSSRPSQPVPKSRSSRATRLPHDPVQHGDPPVDTNERLRLHVLGRPTLRRTYPDGSSGEVFLGRAAAWQILIYLAAHRDGASTDELKEVLWPEVASSSARNRFNTTISHLRVVLADAAGGPVLQHSSDRVRGDTWHQLDPCRIDVDLWQFQDAWRRATTAVDTDTCRDALTDALTAYHGELAETCRYDWAEPLREQLLGQVVDAYACLADLQPDHQAALTLLQQAIHYSPYTEHLYQQAMIRHAGAGNPDGVRRSLATLTARLADARQQPDQTTTTLADKLLARTADRR